MDVTSGRRAGGYLMLVDADGLRHAVRLQTVASLHDADPTQDSTVLVLHGGRTVTVLRPLDEVLAWFV